MSKSQQEILKFLNNKRDLYLQEKMPDSWITNLKKRGEASDGQAHWGTLGKFLKDKDIEIIMLDKNNIKHDFSEDIKIHEKLCVKAKKSPKERNWFENNLEAFFRLVKEGEIGNKTKGHNKHVHTIIWSMLDDGYTFKADDTQEKKIDGYNSTNTSSTTENEKRTIAEQKQKIRQEKK